MGIVGRAKKTARKPTKESQYQPRSTPMHLFFLQAVHFEWVYTVYTTASMDRLKEKDSLCVIDRCFVSLLEVGSLRWIGGILSIHIIIMCCIVYHTSSNFFKRSFRCSISLMNDS